MQARATLAEILRRRADEDDVIFGEPEAFRALLAESKVHFEQAATLDPSDAYSSYHAFFLGPVGHGGRADDLAPAHPRPAPRGTARARRRAWASRRSAPPRSQPAR